MIPTTDIIIRLVLAAIIGGLIGFEREVHGRAAGFRTQLLVCVAAVLIMVISENYYFYIRDLDSSLRIDPARISAGALIGIGFLGAGVIIKSGFAVRGLTTAASIWMVSAIGLAIGGGLYIEGVVTAAITIIALTALRPLERKITGLRFKTISISTEQMDDIEDAISSIITNCNFNIHTINYEKNRGKRQVTYHFIVSTRSRDNVRQLFSELNTQEFVSALRITG